MERVPLHVVELWLAQPSECALRDSLSLAVRSRLMMVFDDFLEVESQVYAEGRGLRFDELDAPISDRVGTIELVSVLAI